jgi:hypothetical protein
MKNAEPHIAVTTRKDEPSGFAFDVEIREAGSTSRHAVTLARADYDRLSHAGEAPDAFLSRCFRFLLARESKESILSRFDVSVIARYFPEFEREIKA